MKLELTFKGATEPQLSITRMYADDMKQAVMLLNKLDSSGLLYAPIEKMVVIMDGTEYINIAS